MSDTPDRVPEAEGLHPLGGAVEAFADREAGPSESPGCDVAMEIVDFEPEAVAPATVAPRLPGPGLPEALGWTFGVFGAHAAATVVVMAVIAALLVATGQLRQLAQVESLIDDYLLLLVGGDQLLVLLLTLAAVSFRFWGRVHRTLNLTPPRPLHVLCVAGLTLPLSTICSQFYRVIHDGWRLLTEHLPPLRLFDASNVVETVQQLAQSASLPVMLLVIAVAPAIAEELVFRGVIGRGLVARWGIVPGVLITSCLFAAVHFHPAHALAVVPLGIAMHLVYLATRSFWAPMLLHFLNNAWATVATKMATSGTTPGFVFSDASAAGTGGVDPQVGPALLLSSLTAVIVLAALLYRTRTRYVREDGEEWNPGYFTVEAPPESEALRRDCGSITGRNLLTAGSAWAAFGAAFAAEVAALAR
jgi:membrane protease YdiL (CAAX protease family)